MKSIIEFGMGSNYFFNVFTDYKSKDTDKLCIMDTFPEMIKSNVLTLKKGNKDIFFYRNMNKDEWIKDTLSSKVSMRVGKFLIPEFCNFIGFTVNDLKVFDEIFNNMDEKHTYEKIIYESYIENGDFVLTDEQRLKAYNEYKRTRKQ